MLHGLPFVLRQPEFLEQIPYFAHAVTKLTYRAATELQRATARPPKQPVDGAPPQRGRVGPAQPHKRIRRRFLPGRPHASGAWRWGGPV
eukprot:11199269-Lingulodinium_polyedra.AAC.1